MKVAVIGSRTFKDYEEMKKTLSLLNITQIISGGATGADTLSEQYAKEKGIPTVIFVPDWKNKGKSAGFIRNSDIVKEAELIVAFWDGESRN
jgi:hypothetical protein